MEHDLYDQQEKFIKNLVISEDEINNIENESRGQANCELWKTQRKYRFTASHRKRSHEAFAKTLMYPKEFRSVHTAHAHGIKYEFSTIHEYIR